MKKYNIKVTACGVELNTFSDRETSFTINKDYIIEAKDKEDAKQKGREQFIADTLYKGSIYGEYTGERRVAPFMEGFADDHSGKYEDITKRDYFVYRWSINVFVKQYRKPRTKPEAEATTQPTERTQSKAEETTADTEANSYDVIIRYPCYRIIAPKAVKNYDPDNRYTHVHKNIVYMDPREYNIKATNEETAKRIAVNKCLDEICTDLKCTHVSQYDKSDYFYAIYDENTHFEILIRDPKIEYKKLESRKIYIVTAVIYSGHHIEAVFDNKDEALKYAALNNTKNYNETDIEEYNLSHIKTNSNIDAYFYYKAHIDVYTDKRVKSMVKAKCKGLNGNEFEQYVPVYEEVNKFDIKCDYEGPRLRESIKSSHWTDLLLKEQNEEKAKKIFQDRFAQQQYMYEMGEITLKEFLGHN